MLRHKSGFKGTLIQRLFKTQIACKKKRKEEEAICSQSGCCRICFYTKGTDTVISLNDTDVILSEYSQSVRLKLLYSCVIRDM